MNSESGFNNSNNNNKDQNLLDENGGQDPVSTEDARENSSPASPASLPRAADPSPPRAADPSPPRAADPSPPPAADPSKPLAADMAEPPKTQQDAIQRLSRILKDARLETGRESGELAHEMNIPHTTLADLEEGTLFGRMSKVFVRGYILAYAKILRLEQTALLELLEIIYSENANSPKPGKPEPPGHLRRGEKKQSPFMTDYEFDHLARKKQKQGMTVVVPILFCVLAVGGLVYWKLFLDSGPDPDTTASVLPELRSASSPEPAAEETQDDASVPPRNLSDEQSFVAVESPFTDTTGDAAIEGSASSKLRFLFLEESWLGVSDNRGKEVAWQLFGPGEDISFGGEPPYKIVIGNAPVTRVWFGGKEVNLATWTEGKVARLVLPLATP